MSEAPIFLTGTAGFIGFHFAQRCLDSGVRVVGIDTLTSYYDVNLKHRRLEFLNKSPNFGFEELDVMNRASLQKLFKKHSPRIVVHLAAQAGVRYSIEQPSSYIDSNLVGFGSILECCRHHAVEHLVFASSSSVYGANRKVPFSERDNVDHPVSLYAATKKANELMAHTYAHLFGIPCTGLRFFTVYGPWGRPDMAYYSFTQKIFAGEPITLFNNGAMERDFTYIDDIVEGVMRVMRNPPSANGDWDGANNDPASSWAPYKILNIGNNKPENLTRFVQVLEDCIGKKASIKFAPMQPGDVPITYADTSALEKAVGYRPSTPIEEGLKKFVDWYREYYQVQ